jgi:hypothetical protein
MIPQDHNSTLRSSDLDQSLDQNRDPDQDQDRETEKDPDQDQDLGQDLDQQRAPPLDPNQDKEPNLPLGQDLEFKTDMEALYLRIMTKYSRTWNGLVTRRSRQGSVAWCLRACSSILSISTKTPTNTWTSSQTRTTRTKDGN